MGVSGIGPKITNLMPQGKLDAAFRASKKELNERFGGLMLSGQLHWVNGKPREILMGPIVLSKPPKGAAGGSILQAWIPRDDPKKVYYNNVMVGAPPGRAQGQWSGPHDIKPQDNPYPPGTRYGLVSRRNLSR